ADQIGLLGVDALMIDDHQNLPRDCLNAAHSFDDAFETPIVIAVGFCLRTFAKEYQIQWLAAVDIRVLEAVHHREYRNENPHRQRNAAHRHHRSDAAHNKTAKIVFNRNHPNDHSPRRRIASAIDRREAPQAGRSVLVNATTMEMPAAVATVPQETTN